MKGHQAELTSEHDIFTFFSSYLRDLLQLASDIKISTYQLLGIDSLAPKYFVVNTNMYSIMEACNNSFEDLRRTSTLLRGHLKAQNSKDDKKESVKQSRDSIRNSFGDRKNTHLTYLKLPDRK